MNLRWRYLVIASVPLFSLHAAAAHAGVQPQQGEFQTAPTPTSPTSITMTSVYEGNEDINGNITDDTYDFTYSQCGVNDGTGGASSPNQVDDTYVNTGLQPNKCYAYTVQGYTDPNTSGSASIASPVASTYTLAATPGAPTVTPLSDTTALLSNDENGNPASSPTTLFAVQLTSAADSTWNNQYVDASGAPSATAVWLSDLSLDGLTLTGLSPGTTYAAQSKALNFNNIETAFGSATSFTTTSTGDGGDSGGGDDGGGLDGLIQRIFRIGGNVRLMGGLRLY